MFKESRNAAPRLKNLGLFSFKKQGKKQGTVLRFILDETALSDFNSRGQFRFQVKVRLRSGKIRLGKVKTGTG